MSLECRQPPPGSLSQPRPPTDSEFIRWVPIHSPGAGGVHRQGGGSCLIFFAILVCASTFSDAFVPPPKRPKGEKGEVDCTLEWLYGQQATHRVHRVHRVQSSHRVHRAHPFGISRNRSLPRVQVTGRPCSVLIPYSTAGVEPISTCPGVLGGRAKKSSVWNFWELHVWDLLRAGCVVRRCAQFMKPTSRALADVSRWKGNLGGLSTSKPTDSHHKPTAKPQNTSAYTNAPRATRLGENSPLQVISRIGGHLRKRRCDWIEAGGKLVTCAGPRVALTVAGVYQTVK